MSAPLVSVVIPSRNGAKYLMETLQSVFAQTFKDLEIIVVDDGSTDGTPELLKPLIEQGRLRYVYQPPTGLSSARNTGVKHARGEYIAFLDADDLFMPSKLEKQLALFSQCPELGLVHCWFSKFNDAGQDLGLRNTSFYRGQIYPHILQQWSVLMAVPCVLVRKDVVVELGGFDEEMFAVEDLDMWRRISRNYAFDLVEESLVKVRVHANSMSFDKTHTGGKFVYYLEKALKEDPQLSPTFQNAARATMYTKLGQNLLGEGGALQMQVARQHAARALRAQWLHLPAWLTLLASFLPLALRRRLVTGLRGRRYPAT